MKANKTILMAVLAAGSLLVWSPAMRADDSTNQPPSTLPAGVPTTSTNQRPAGMRGPNFDQLAQRLELTDDQKAKFKPILEAQMKKMRDLRSDTSLTSQDRRTQMQAIREETATQLKAVLTPEQYDQWQKMSPLGQRGPRLNGPRPDGGIPGSTNAPAAPPQN